MSMDHGSGNANGANGTSGEHGQDGKDKRGREPRSIKPVFVENDSSDDDFSTDDEDGPLAAVLLPLVPPQGLPPVPEFNMPQVAGVNLVAAAGQMLGDYFLHGAGPAIPLGGAEVLLDWGAVGQAAGVGGQAGQAAGVGGQAGQAAGGGHTCHAEGA